MSRILYNMQKLGRLSALVRVNNYNLNNLIVRRHESTVTDPDIPNFNMENPYEKEKQQCILCRHKIQVDYKNVKLLSQFQSSYTGRIYGRHITGLCKKQQELVEKEIDKAQNAGLMGYYLKEEIYLKDPKLFDVERPLRPHRF